MRHLLAAACFAAFGVTMAWPQDYGQPSDERQQQEALPRSQDPIWVTLSGSQIDEDDAKGIFTIHNNLEIEKLAGQTLTVSGFMMPLDTDAKSAHFILTRNTPVCPFCPPGAPNEVIEVHMTDPIEPSYDMIRVTGRFALEDNGEKGLFYRLDDAVLATDDEAGR